MGDIPLSYCVNLFKIVYLVKFCSKRGSFIGKQVDLLGHVLGRVGSQQMKPVEFTESPRSTNASIALRLHFFEEPSTAFPFLWETPQSLLSSSLSPKTQGFEEVPSSSIGVEERTLRFVASYYNASLRTSSGALRHFLYLERRSVHLSSRCLTILSGLQ